MNALKISEKPAFGKMLILLISISVLFLNVCSAPRIERVSVPPNQLPVTQSSEEHPYLKLHMQNGEVYVLENWEVNEEFVSGIGKRLNTNRELISEGEFRLPVGQVVLVETNRIDQSLSEISLIALTLVTGTITAICIAQPKACFGSCPTFYIDDGTNYIIQAEGFSASIIPALEEKDIDALYRARPKSDSFTLQVKNEAYETHIIRSVNILALPKPAGGRVFSTQDGEFYQTKNLQEAFEVVAPEGDISEKLCTYDGDERFSETDSTDLAVKEVVELTFNHVTAGEKGLVIASRQTLLTTFLLYQSLSYMGTKAGDWFANIERHSEKYDEILKSQGSGFGYIEVLLKNDNGEWEKVGEVGETGPIANDIKIVPLQKIIDREETDSPLSIRLRMTKGLWRMDYVALADMIGSVEPIIINPSSSSPEESSLGNVVELLTNPDSVLVTLPGNSYFLNYTLPSDYNNYEFFVESQGYYLEWMRDEWIREENSAKVFQMIFNPKQYYKDLAPQFKQVEAEMEETFWSSKYVLP